MKTIKKGTSQDIYERILRGEIVSRSEYKDTDRDFGMMVHNMQSLHPALKLERKTRKNEVTHVYLSQKTIALVEHKNSVYRTNELNGRSLPRFSQTEGWMDVSGCFHNYKQNTIGGDFVYDTFYLVCTGDDLREGKFYDLERALVHAGAYSQPYAIDIYYTNGNHLSLPGKEFEKLYSVWGLARIVIRQEKNTLVWQQNGSKPIPMDTIRCIKVVYDAEISLY